MKTKSKIIKMLELGQSLNKILPELNERDRGIYELRKQGKTFKEIQIALSASPNQIAFINKYLIKKHFDSSATAIPDTIKADAEPGTTGPAIKLDAEPESIKPVIKADAELGKTAPAIKLDAEPESIKPVIKADAELGTTEPAIKSDAALKSMDPVIKKDDQPQSINPAFKSYANKPTVKPAFVGVIRRIGLR